jgi:LuxR family maltose regulon positive regulatory protein
VIAARVLRACALHDAGRTAEALSALGPALELGEPEGLVRVFVGAGEPIVALLRELVRQGTARAEVVAYARRLLQHVADRGAKGRGKDQAMGERAAPSQESRGVSLVEPLSPREMDVLRLLNSSLSTVEIAKELYVSVNTVRTHVRNIYAKLDVHRRMDAVRRAQELGLL